MCDLEVKQQTIFRNWSSPFSIFISRKKGMPQRSQKPRSSSVGKINGELSINGLQKISPKKIFTCSRKTDWPLKNQQLQILLQNTSVILRSLFRIPKTY